eukprot:2076993-Alexandrium_andersonii.AAC.1
MRTVSLELCIFCRDQLRAFEKVQKDMLDAAALQPWRRQPQWTARDMQLPAMALGHVPVIMTKKELYHGA